jgi:hypothetical protein
VKHRVTARVVEDRSSGTLTVNHFSVKTNRSTSHRYGLNLGHDSSIRISRRGGGRERPINTTVYPPWRTTRATRELLSIRTISGYPVLVRSIQ